MITAIWSTVGLFGYAFQIILYFWPVSLLLGLHAVVATLFTRPSTSMLALIVPFIWPVLILLVGASFWHAGPRWAAPDLPIAGVAILFLIQLILSAGIIYELRGRRWSATAVCLVAAWLGLISWFLAGMALTNVWV